MLVCLNVARKVRKSCNDDIRSYELWLLLPVMGLVSELVGLISFRTKFFSHAMFNWEFSDYLLVAIGNVGLVFIPAMLIMGVTRPWYLTAKAGLKNTLITIVGFLLLYYFIAFLGYVASPTWSVE